MGNKYDDAINVDEARRVCWTINQGTKDGHVIELGEDGVKAAKPESLVSPHDGTQALATMKTSYWG